MKSNLLKIAVVLFIFTGLACGPSSKKNSVRSTLEAAEEDPFINYNKGVMLFKRKEYSVAAGYLAKAVQLEPTNGAYWNTYGLVLGQMGEFEAAIEAFHNALEAQPGMTDVHNNLGMVYTETGQFDKALEEYGLVLQDKTYPTPEFAYFNIGLLKQRRGKLEEAMMAFEQVVALQPDFYRAYGALADIYFKNRMYGDAYNAVKKAQKQKPGDPGLLLLEAKSQVRLGKLKDAERVLTKLGLMYPSKEIREEMDRLKAEISRMQRSN